MGSPRRLYMDRVQVLIDLNLLAPGVGKLNYRLTVKAYARGCFWVDPYVFRLNGNL